MTDATTIADQIIAQRRVLELLGRVYPVMVKTGKMTQSHADEHIAALRAVMATLEGRPGMVMVPMLHASIAWTWLAETECPYDVVSSLRVAAGGQP